MRVLKPVSYLCIYGFLPSFRPVIAKLAVEIQSELSKHLESQVHFKTSQFEDRRDWVLCQGEITGIQSTIWGAAGTTFRVD